MVQLVYDFRIRENWILKYTGELIAEPVPDQLLRRYYPIPDFTVPSFFDSEVLAIFIRSDSDPGFWKKAGYARQQIKDVDGAELFLENIVRSQRLTLRKTTFCFFTKIEGSYQVILQNIPYWLESVNFQIWEYKGDIYSPELESLRNLINQLL